VLGYGFPLAALTPLRLVAVVEQVGCVVSTELLSVPRKPLKEAVIAGTVLPYTNDGLLAVIVNVAWLTSKLLEALLPWKPPCVA
jgi:hypothetical protein